VSRLYDRIRRFGTDAIPFEPEHPDEARQPLGEETVVSADNVYRCFFAAEPPRDGEHWDVNRDVPNFAPPFGRYFIEGALPPPAAMSPGWRAMFGGQPAPVSAAGALIRARDFGHDADAAAAYADDRLNSSHLNRFDVAGNPRPDWGALAVSDPVRWTLDASFFFERPGVRRPLQGALRMFLAVRPDGAAAKTDSGSTARLATLSPGTTPEAAHALGRTLDAVTLPLFLADAFFHCKNIHLTPVDPPPRLQRSFRKKAGRPMTRYHVLEIDAVCVVLDREARRAQGDLRRAFHLCRGHFKHYTPERGGPFGRPIDAPMSLWVSHHVRGNRKEGTVEKDYAFRPPKRPGPGSQPPGAVPQPERGEDEPA
jgi:hypothetical protein